ncbi:MAG: diaminopimelate epimerase [Deltaproteobacteria bacterium]|nr:diaminopimelate epimerase [Deltaproteobacteria bacterium]
MSTERRGGLRFSKYEGLGNDFIIVDGAAQVDTERAVELCDRHRGIGADGVLIVNASAPSMEVINADGSVPEMCGNGLRCVVWHLVREGHFERGAEHQIQTGAGPHLAKLHGDGDVEIWMSAPTLEPKEVPMAADGPRVDAPIEVVGRTLSFTAVGMGNPHAVIFDELTAAERLEYGPQVQAHQWFPAGVNVGFARMVDGGLELHVLERGSGWTQACGTGACAAAVAAVETGRAERGTPIRVELPGGALTIVVGEPGERVRMRGPARHVFDGELR